MLAKGEPFAPLLHRAILRLLFLLLTTSHFAFQGTLANLRTGSGCGWSRKCSHRCPCGSLLTSNSCTPSTGEEPSRPPVQYFVLGSGPVETPFLVAASTDSLSAESSQEDIQDHRLCAGWTRIWEGDPGLSLQHVQCMTVIRGARMLKFMRCAWLHIRDQGQYIKNIQPACSAPSLWMSLGWCI